MNPAWLGLFAALIAAVLTVGAAVYFKASARRVERQLREEFVAMEARLKETQGHFVENANERFISEQIKSKAMLEQSKQSLESRAETLGKEISRLTTLVSDIEKERQTKYGALEEKLAQSALATQGLFQATNQLSSILGNNQQRGLLGQRIADDILSAAGLEEGLHYVKDRAQETVSTRPDYSFRLPDEHKIYMDVKFPLNNYLALAKATDKESQARFTEDFIRDVKARIKELKKRDYINPEEQTLDFIILFIPSEEVFSFIHRAAPGLMDEALSQKILMAAPYSLYGVLSILRQAYDNFSFKQRLGEILQQITQFFGDYENFKKRFEELGKAIGKSRDVYDDIDTKSFKKLELRAKKLDEFRKGEQAEHPVVLESTPAWRGGSQ